MWIDIFSKADWINKERVTVYPRIFVALYAAAIVIVLSLSPHLIDPHGKNIGTDFMTVWSAGKLVLEGKAADAYDYQKHFDVQRAALPWKEGQEVPYYGWLYPPLFLVVAAGLALLPYGWALALWMIATLPAYLATIRAILPGRAALMAALAFPGVFVNLGHGQNGFVTAGLFGGGLLLLEKRPYSAGFLFGLMAYKPQFGVLIPLALLAGGHWRTIISATLTVLAATAASYALFGMGTWQAFFDSLQLTRGAVLEQGSAGWEKIQSLFSAVRMLGGSPELAYAAQTLYAIVAAAATLWVWRSRAGLDIKSATLVTASMMVTPYMFDYDLIVLALPVAWLAALGLRRGFLDWEKTTLLAAGLLPLLSRAMGQYLHIPIEPLVIAALLLIILRRAVSTTS
jgi:hypothetical protein